MNSMLLPLKRYAEFSGRSGRAEYWMFQLLQFIVMIFCFLLIIFGAGERGLAGLLGNGWGTTSTIGVAFIVAWAVLTFIPNIAVTVRRFHDQDLEGWLILFNLIPYLGQFVVFVFMCLPGTTGDNKFGPDPKQAPSDVAQLSKNSNDLSSWTNDAPEVQKLSLSGFDGSGHIVKLILDPKAASVVRRGWKIGRSTAADLPVNDRAVSREHAEIELSGSAFLIRDLGSTNGTMLNGRKLTAGEACQLWSGDTVIVGKVELSVSAV